MAASLFVSLTPWPGLNEWLYWRRQAGAAVCRVEGEERWAAPAFPEHIAGLDLALITGQGWAQ